MVQGSQDGVETLKLSGSLGGAEHGLDLRERIDVLLWEKEPTVVIDLTRVVRIDSAFVGHLLECHVNLRARGGNLVVVARGLPREILRLSRLDEMLDVRGQVTRSDSKPS
jgi:anti-anti-sigma regulatory factor